MISQHVRPLYTRVTKSRICLRIKTRYFFNIHQDTIIALNFFSLKDKNTLWESGEILLSVFPKNTEEDLSTQQCRQILSIEITPKTNFYVKNKKYKLPIISHHRIYLVNLYQRALQNLFPLIYPHIINLHGKR